MNSQALNTIISEKIDIRWSDWAPKHPHLAEAIDRVRLTESTVSLLRDDPGFIAAMREADLDEAGLIKASRLLEHADNLIRRLFPI